MGKVEELKQAAIKHWEDNLKKLEKIDWAWWEDLTYFGRRNVLALDCMSVATTQVHAVSELPHIFSSGCAYCKEYIGCCDECPLHDGLDEYVCCLAWERARDSFIKKPTTKEAAIEAFKAMIDYIKEKG